ncbi:unnamed protein product [Cuscuta epithymum]|uniref:Uncharacterized protein n=2 Tax=Cuscuta epithymum TaxID=186058 RepID=A0AAV0FMX9_9ASTE|nr:unnamed protein product [Cuscuta epithymum]
MASSSISLQNFDDDDGFDWEAAVREIDVACEATAAAVSVNETLSSSSHGVSTSAPIKKTLTKPNGGAPASARQSTLDKFLEFSPKAKNAEPSPHCSNPFGILNEKDFDNEGDERVCFVPLDLEAAKTWIYPANLPRRDYQFEITRTALFSNTLVALPTGLGKTFIAAVVMYNYFRWFPEGKIVFAAPSKPLVMQQIEACHNIVDIPQEYAIDLTGQTSPTRRKSFWKEKRVFFVTPQVLERDILSGICMVKHLVCLVIDEAHRATGNYSYCVVVRELMAVPVQLRILALSATPGSKQQDVQHIIDNLQISTLEYRDENDRDVLPHVHDRKIEHVKVAMGQDADEINNLLSDVIRPFAGRLSAFGLLQNRDFQRFNPCDILDARARFRRDPPKDIPQVKYGDVEGYFGVLLTLYHVRKLLSSHGIRPAFEMLDEKLRQGQFARLVSRNEDLLKAKLLMQKTVDHGASNPKLSKMLEILIDHFKMNDPQNSRVIIFSNFRGSVRDIMDAITNIGPSIKATEFVGQNSGKTLKGQSQKVQQAVLEKFRAGGYNVIVATSIGEEGLDIMEVDLVICFDSNLSPLRMTQRMGRTGRKHEGRVVVLACEGPELKGFLRKQATNKVLGKLMANGGTNTFRFHPSPRMIPHALRPEVQHVKLLIEAFVPRGKKSKDALHVQSPVLQNELSDKEINLLAKYFNSNGESLWRPSLIAFRHFQAFPSRVHSVSHSLRTEMLIDAMQHLEGLSCSGGIKASSQAETSRDLCTRGGTAEAYENGEAAETYEDFKAAQLYENGEAAEPYENGEDPKTFSCLPIEDCGRELLENDKSPVPVKTIAEAMSSVNEFTGRTSHAHLSLFESELVKVDNLGNVLVLSVPQLSTKAVSESKLVDTDVLPSKLSTEDACDHFMSPVDLILEKNQGFEGKHADHGERMKEHVLVVSRLRNDVDECQGDGSQSERVPESPFSQVESKDISVGEHPEAIITDSTDVSLNEELSYDSEDVEAHSPRLTNFIKSGVVPESPMCSPERDKDEGNKLSSESIMGPLKQDKQAVHCSTGGEESLPSHIVKTITPLQKEVGARAPTSSHSIIICGNRTPLAKLSSPTCSKDWLLESQHLPERVCEKNKLRRLRKLGDVFTKTSPECARQNNVSPKKLASSCFTANRVVSRRKHRGNMKQATDAKAFIEVEAEVSSDGLVSDDEEEEYCNSYDDSFIDDRLSLTAVDTQADSCRMDMMAVYRRSLLTQSPVELLPKASSFHSPDNAVPRSVTNLTSSSSGTMNHRTPQTGLESTSRSSEAMPYGTAACSLGEKESNVGSRKRKFSFSETSPLPARNLEGDFGMHHGAGGRNSALPPVQEHSEKENMDLFDDDDFLNGIDLDAVEQEAAKILQLKSQNSVHNQPTSISIPQNIGISDFPSFDLGF